MAIREKEEDDINSDSRNDEGEDNNSDGSERVMENRKEKRKAAKKEKRKQKRRELAELARREEEARLNDPAVQMQLQAEEEREKERAERERIEFEERERVLLEAWERKRAQEAEEEKRRKALEEEEKLKRRQVGSENELDEDGWEYVEEGLPEIIWQGNEIIVKKKKVRVKKTDADHHIVKEDPNRPTSNPLPPQKFADYKTEPIISAQQLLENVAQQTPNFGTEQDKSHCPFHLKTGACRFGSSCSRIHFYPDKSCTLLIKNMYNGPGLSWEQDEGLENNISEWKKVQRSFLAEFHSKDVALHFTDEEVERAYEEFYEDVHTEFLKFGELVNFKVCRNGSSHLRGNVYVHYRSLDSAVVAYQTINGRYFAGKMVQCEYVGVTRWKVAICGEFMKSKLKSCSRGMACNFIHCFRNPGGDYEWADWEKPPPKYWVKKMVALFGYSDEYGYEKQLEHESPRLCSSSYRTSTYDRDRYHYRRSQSRESDYPRRMSRKYSEDHDIGRTPQRLEGKHYKDSLSSRKTAQGKSPSSDYDSDRGRFDRDSSRDGHCDSLRKSSRHRHDGKMGSHDSQSFMKRTGEDDVNANLSDWERDKDSHCRHERKCRRVERKKSLDLDKDRAINSSTDWLDDNRRAAMDDRSRRYDNELDGELCDNHWQPATTAMESEGAKYEAEKARKVKHSNSGGNRKSSSYGRNYRYSDYDSDSSFGWLGSGKRSSKNLKITKGIQDTDKHCDSKDHYDSKDRVQCHDENEMHANVYHEPVDERGRWEPDEVVSFKHYSNKRKSHGKDHMREPKRNDKCSESSDENCNDGKSPRGSRSSKRKHSGSMEQRNFSKRFRI